MDSCTTLQLHITPPQTTTPIIHCTYDAHIPSTIAPITQLSPITHLPWLSHHTCTSFTHTHISSTLPCTHCEVLFSPVWHFQAVSLSVFPWTAYMTLTVCCLPFDPACRLISSLFAACPDLCIAPVADPALPSLHLLLSLNLACLTSSCLSIKLHLDLTTLPLHYRRPVFLCGSVVDHCVRSAKGCGFDSQGTHILMKMYNLNAIVSRFG